MLINEDSFRSFFELSLDLFIIVDFDGNVLEANNVWEEALGYQRSDLLNHSLFEFVNADDQTATSGRMTESAQGQDIRNFENRWNAKDGSVRTLRWRSRVDHNRKLVFGVAVDVTAERIAFELLEHAKNDATESLRQETLAKREENLLRQRLLKLFMQVPALAAVLKGPGHVFELANENFQKLLGERDVVGLSAVVAIPGLDCTRVQILDNVYRTGRGYRATAEAVTADWRADGQMSERIFDFIYEPILA
ncbi:MAG: PAS domain S-box protein, partial [Proteobacteria bacterium]